MDSRIAKRLEKVNEDMFKNELEGPSEPREGASNEEIVQVGDLHEQRRRERYMASQKTYPRGASPKVRIALMTLVENVAPVHAKVKAESEYLTKIGDKTRAKMARDGYMEDTFLPALESLVYLYGVDEVLNSRDALRKLDEFVLIDGGSGSGYSESFIRTLHGSERGIAPAVSDGVVENSVRDIRRLVERDEIRSAIGLAKRMRDQIEKGQHSASEEDWDLISTVAMRG